MTKLNNILDFSKPKIMGVLNITPDSFSDGGDFFEPQEALKNALKIQDDGADILDIGGESSRPGAKPVGVDEELARVIPIIENLKDNLKIPISIDTCKPEVMKIAVKNGVNIINDITALENPKSLQTVSELNVPVCLMHMQGEPRNMQKKPKYDDVVTDIFYYLKNRVDICLKAGIKKQNIIIDPGFGFGKTLTHNLDLLKNLDKFKELDLPILVGVSRKSMIGQILNLENPKDRLIGGLTLHHFAVNQGASIIRTHDVKETKEMLGVLQVLKN